MSTIKANTLLHSDGSTTNPPSIPALDQRMAKAWVNFNMTGTQAIRSSYNVSSITDTNTGQTTVSFTNPVHVDRAVTGLSSASGFVSLYRIPTLTSDGGEFRCIHNNGTVSDFIHVFLTYFGE